MMQVRFTGLLKGTFGPAKLPHLVMFPSCDVGSWHHCNSSLHAVGAAVKLSSLHRVIMLWPLGESRALRVALRVWSRQCKLSNKYGKTKRFCRRPATYSFNVCHVGCKDHWITDSLCKTPAQLGRILRRTWVNDECRVGKMPLLTKADWFFSKDQYFTTWIAHLAC